MLGSSDPSQSFLPLDLRFPSWQVPCSPPQCWQGHLQHCLGLTSNLLPTTPHSLGLTSNLLPKESWSVGRNQCCFISGSRRLHCQQHTVAAGHETQGQWSLIALCGCNQYHHMTADSKSCVTQPGARATPSSENWGCCKPSLEASKAVDGSWAARASGEQPTHGRGRAGGL